MKGVGVAGVAVVCVLSAGCGGGREQEEIAERNPGVMAPGDGRPQPVNETGCLTAAGDRFVLTALEPGAAGPGAREGQGAGTTADPQPTTVSYQLIGRNEELRKLVGRQVRVSGEAQPPKVAEVRESSPQAEPRGTAGSSGADARRQQPQVSSTTETRLEVTQLRVQSITATGKPCAASATGDRRR